MIAIFSKKFTFASKSFYSTKNFFGKKYNFFFEEDLNSKKIQYINKNYKVILVFHKVNLERVLLNKIKAKLILFVDHPFSKNFKKFLKKYNKYINDKKIYFETYKCYQNFVPNFIEKIPRSYWQKINKSQNFKKRYDIIYVSGKSKIFKFDFILNIFIIILAYLLSEKKLISIKEINNYFLYRMLFNLSFSGLHSKYSILYQMVRYFKRKMIKKELEKLDNVKIIFAGSKQFLPKNYYKKFDWLFGKQLIEYVKKTKFIIIPDCFTGEINERLYLARYNCLPLIHDNQILKKSLLSNYSFNKKKKLSKLISDLEKKDKKSISILLNKLISLCNMGYNKDPYSYYLKKVKD